MSITLKRPMFKKGGMANEGIMNLATPRKNYARGTDEEIQEIFETSGLTPSGKSYAETAMRLANVGRPSSNDLIARALISGGLGAMSETGAGSTLGNIAKAFKKPVAGSVDAYIKGKGSGVAGALKGLELGIKKDIADRTIDARLKNKTYESGTDAARIKQMLNLLGGDALSAEDRYKAGQLSREDIRGQNALGPRYRGIALPDPKDKSRLSLKFLQSQDDGDILLHPFTRKFVVKKSDPIRVEPINQTTFEEITGD